MRICSLVIACLLVACLVLLPSMAAAARHQQQPAAAASSSAAVQPAAASNVKPVAPAAPVLPTGVTEVPADFTNGAGERLVGLLSTSSDASAPKRVAIIVTGMLYNKKSIFYPALANRLLTSTPGSALAVNTVLRFDWSGMGGSQGVFNYGGYKQLVADLESAVKYVHEKLALPVHAIIGHSMGSDVVLLYGSKYPHLSSPFHVANIVAISPRYDMTKGEEGRFSPEALAQMNTLGYAPWVVSPKLTVNVTKATLNEKVHTDLSVVRQLRDGPNTLIVFGDADTTIPPADGKTIAAIILSGKAGTQTPPASLVVPAITVGGAALRPQDVKAVGSTLRHSLYLLPGADHAYTNPSTASEQLAQTVNAWLQGVNGSKSAARPARRAAKPVAAPAAKKAASSAASKLRSLKKKIAKKK